MRGFWRIDRQLVVCEVLAGARDVESYFLSLSGSSTTMKIAILGSAGTGKTTVATALAKGCTIPLIEESYDEFFDGNFKFLNPPHRLKSRILVTFDSKDRQEDSLSDFVADRCPVDLFNLWMTQGFGRDQKLTATFYDQCRRAMTKYDYVVVLPWGAIPLKQISEPGFRRRTMNPWSQLHNHATVIGLVHQWVQPERLVPIPFGLSNISDRVSYLARKFSIPTSI
ncbi:MAG: hypothetical protein ACI915_000162 [Gammaproteobacteria bacterium]